MQPTEDLKYKYDDYEEDFHQEDHDKNQKGTEYQVQTNTLLSQPKQEKTQQNEDHYDQKFESEYGESRLDEKKLEVRLETNKKVYDNNPNRQKMIEQNIKLKTQIYELAKQMDQIVQRQKKQKKYGIHADEEQDEAIKTKKAELKKQQVQIMNLKNKIFLTKRQLQHVYDSRGIQGKEDELKNLQKQLKVLQEEKEALLKVKRQQTKALKMIKNDNEYEQKVKLLKEQLSKTKEECKHLSQKLMENERILRKNHELYITKQARIKEMENKIKENKEKAKKANDKNTTIITNEMIQEVDDQIIELEKERKEAQKTWNEKIQSIQSELQQKRVQQEKKLLILKEKEKELKLNEIRIKELKKLIQHHSNEGSGGKKQEEGDMKQFRHKRNIKQMQK